MSLEEEAVIFKEIDWNHKIESLFSQITQEQKGKRDRHHPSKAACEIPIHLHEESLN